LKLQYDTVDCLTSLVPVTQCRTV